MKATDIEVGKMYLSRYPCPAPREGIGGNEDIHSVRIVRWVTEISPYSRYPSGFRVVYEARPWNGTVWGEPVQCDLQLFAENSERLFAEEPEPVGADKAAIDAQIRALDERRIAMLKRVEEIWARLKDLPLNTEEGTKLNEERFALGCELAEIPQMIANLAARDKPAPPFDALLAEIKALRADIRALAGELRERRLEP